MGATARCKTVPRQDCPLARVPGAFPFFSMLVAKVALDAQAKRRAVSDLQILAVHLVGEDGLRVEGVEIYALVIGSAAAQRLFELVCAA